MPVTNRIRGISERRQIPRLGKIHLGVRQPNANGRGDHPVQTDYFVVPEVLKPYVGVQPTSLLVTFHSDNPDDFVDQHLRRYGSGTGLSCIGDGYEARALVLPAVYRAWLEANDGDLTALPMPGLWAGGRPEPGQEAAEWRDIRCYGAGYDGEDACPAYQAGACGPSLHLQFVLPEAPGFGVWQIDTGSPMSIERINSFVEFLRTATGGRIAGIPLRLSLEKVRVAPGGRATDVNVLRLDFDGTFREALAYAQRPAGVAGLLAEPSTDDAPPEDVGGEADTPVAHDTAHAGTDGASTAPPVPAGVPRAETPRSAPSTNSERQHGVLPPPDPLAGLGHLLQWARYHYGWDTAAVLRRAQAASTDDLALRVHSEYGDDWNAYAFMIAPAEDIVGDAEPFGDAPAASSEASAGSVQFADVGELLWAALREYDLDRTQVQGIIGSVALPATPATLADAWSAIERYVAEHATDNA